VAETARLSGHSNNIREINPAASATPEAGPQLELSVVVPVHNETGNIQSLVGEIVGALTGVASFEIVYVDDGSSDTTLDTLTAARQQAPMLRVLRHARSMGQSTALRTVVLAARGLWIATLDGDGQNDPADIPALLALARELVHQRGDNAVLIAGWRSRRRDGWYTRWQSKIANALRARLLRDGTPDTGCGLKVYARELFIALPYFDHMHRFMPALVQQGGGRVVSVPVNHQIGRAHV
jgi:dolichol-phosphate mannosyltransferase